MPMRDEVKTARAQWRAFTIYAKFEHLVVSIVAGLIAISIVAAVWNLTLKILYGLILSGSFDPTDYQVFQVVSGMIFAVIIALEFKRSLLVVTQRRKGIVQVRTVILLAMLAIVRQVDHPRSHDHAMQLFTLAAAILALGAGHWLVREQDRRADV